MKIFILIFWLIMFMLDLAVILNTISNYSEIKEAGDKLALRRIKKIIFINATELVTAVIMISICA